MIASLSIDSSTTRQRYLLLFLLLIAAFALISVIGTPFLYDRANSGRYLLEVIWTADPELFPQDSVVDSLKRFDSAFYNALALAFQITDAPPIWVEPTIKILYVIYQFALFFALFLFGRRLSRGLWFFILLGAWAAHQKGFPVGGNTLFSPQLTHSSIAFLLGIFALYALMTRHHFWFWVLSGLAVVTHSLHGLHLVLIVAPVYWVIHHQFDRSTIVGFVAFFIFVLVYVLFMAPPPMSPQGAQIFLEIKGNMYHVSPLDHSSLDWIKAFGIIGLSLLVYMEFLRENHNARLLCRFVVFGTIIAILLGTMAIIFQPVRLVQFQPMRIFFWAGFLANILILLGANQALARRSPIVFLLLGYLLLSIVESLWFLPFTIIAVAYLTIKIVISHYRPAFLPALEQSAQRITLALFLVMIGGWLAAHTLNLSIATLLDSTPLLLVAILVILAFSAPLEAARQHLLIGALIFTALFSVSLYRHEYYGPPRVDPDWQVVQQWSQQNTAKTDTFITTPNAEGNFRTRSFRTTLSEPMSALCWVDPLECRRNAERVAQVEQAREDGRWNVPGLIVLARQWSSQYILVADEYSSNIAPVFHSGRYAIFQVP